MPTRTAIAIAAHPDDIEFNMAGTLLLLKKAGWEIHYINLATGNGGSVEWDSETTAQIRREEAREAAAILGAKWHPSITHDMGIFYNDELLRKVSAVVRETKASIVLTHPLQDYMEDHTNAARLAVTAAFTHGIPNYQTDPPQPPYFHDVTVYHCMPHSGRDPMRRRVVPGAWVNTTTVHTEVLKSLAAHRSQQGWLDASQGMAYLEAKTECARSLGELSGIFEMAEGWTRHQHTGFSTSDIDPLSQVLAEDYLLNSTFEDALELRPLML